ncbi:MAG: universal stress protein [Candidatus Promineifilaceae bacterium]
MLNEARDGAYDLLVIGSHQARGWQRFLLDDLAHQIVVQADRPVLVV